MEVGTMTEKMENWRKELRNKLWLGDDVEIFCIDVFKNCCSEFEEQCVVENFREVFEDFMMECKNRAA